MKSYYIDEYVEYLVTNNNKQFSSLNQLLNDDETWYAKDNDVEYHHRHEISQNFYRFHTFSFNKNDIKTILDDIELYKITTLEFYIFIYKILTLRFNNCDVMSYIIDLQDTCTNEINIKFPISLDFYSEEMHNRTIDEIRRQFKHNLKRIMEKYEYTKYDKIILSFEENNHNIKILTIHKNNKIYKFKFKSNKIQATFNYMLLGKKVYE